MHHTHVNGKLVAQLIEALERGARTLQQIAEGDGVAQDNAEAIAGELRAVIAAANIERQL